MVGRITISPCRKCWETAINNGDIPDSTMYEMLTPDDGVVAFQCENGHKNAIIIQEQSFEILLEIAIENIIDKYYREAIFNFAAAQERCFSFFSELILFEKGVDDTIYKDLWKRVYKNYSERQLGAFYFLYLMRFGKKIDYDDNLTRIRNDIIHKGKIATKKDVFKYGKYVLNNIYTIIESATENISPDMINNFILIKMYEKKSKSTTQEDISISTLSSSIISWLCTTDEEYEQEQKLVQYSKSHREEYTQKVAEANSYGNKKLYINEKNELVIIDAPDINMKKEGAHYRGRRSLEELIKQVKKIREHYNITRAGLVEKSSIVSCLDE